MPHAFLCDAIRTPVGSYGGVLAQVRTDDLAAIPIRVLMERNPGVDVCRLDDVVHGCANQAGEDNRNVARMALLLAGLPVHVSGTTVNRLCGSGMDAIGIAARAINAGEQSLVIAGGVESVFRAPFVMAKATAAFSRNAEVFDTTTGLPPCFFTGGGEISVHEWDSCMPAANAVAHVVSSAQNRPLAAGGSDSIEPTESSTTSSVVDGTTRTRAPSDTHRLRRG